MTEYVDCRECNTECARADGNYGYTFCSCFKPKKKPMTNADRINAMTIEEKAEFLMKLMGHAQCFAEGIFPYHPCPQGQNCKQCGIEWLQQPAEEDCHD